MTDHPSPSLPDPEDRPGDPAGEPAQPARDPAGVPAHDPAGEPAHEMPDAGGVPAAPDERTRPLSPHPMTPSFPASSSSAASPGPSPASPAKTPGVSSGGASAAGGEGSGGPPGGPPGGGPPPGTPYVFVQTGGHGRGVFWVAGLLLFCFVLSAGLNLILMVALAASGGEPTSEVDRLVEKQVEPAADTSTTDKIAVVEVSGVISDAATFDLLTGGTRSTVDHVRTMLRRIESDDSVKGVILRIDSPGGGVTASDLIHHEITTFREETDKPIVALMMDLAASGGYYIAAPCDKIVAHETTLTGSIGVILSFYNLTEMGEKIGVDEIVIKSGENKDLGSMFREMSDGEREILQGVIDGMYERFVDVVDEGRDGLTREQVLPLADGRVFSGREAKEVGLVDEVGYFEKALELVLEEAGIEDAKVVKYENTPTLGDILSGNAQGPAPERVQIEVNVIDLEGIRRTPRLLYMWRP